MNWGFGRAGMTFEDADSYNRRQWEALVAAGVVCSRPMVAVTEDQARAFVDRHGALGTLRGRRILCLANGGGQQAVACAVLGGEVTSLDQSEGQLARDREAATNLGVPIRTMQGDMRDLSPLGDAAFDLVLQGYSINYVPAIGSVFDEVVRVLAPGGLYELTFHNPLAHGSWIDGCWGSRWPRNDLWRREGYPIRLPYVEGAPITTLDQHWNFFDAEGHARRVRSPQEFRHLLSTVVNGLAARGLTILRLEEGPAGDPTAEPGTWEHYVSFAAPWLTIWSRKQDLPVNAPGTVEGICP